MVTRLIPHVVFLLGGQGSQYFGMARSLYEKDARFRALQEELDEIAILACGRSPLSYLHRSRIGGPCDDLELTSLGLFMVEYGLAVRLRDHGLEPDIIVGASLGEFISLAVSGMADPHMALGFIARFTRAIPSVLPAGGMTAVLGSLEAVTAAVKSDEVSLASVNSDQHVVLSGKSSALADVSRRLAISGAICCELPVRYPFHSSACDSLGALMRRLVDGYSHGFSAADRVSVTGPETWSSSIAGPRTSFSGTAAWEAIARPIRFSETIRALPKYESNLYVDLTPSGSLAAALKSMRVVRAVHSIVTPFGRDPEMLSDVLREAKELGVLRGGRAEFDEED